MLEESALGWKEYELEVMRDKADNVVIICSIENLDPMGVHTGESITVAPAQTLTDVEYQQMRDAAIAIMREIGVETGGSNVQFADPSRDRRDDRHRDEPPRLPLLGPGLQGDGLPHRQDRREAGRRLYPRRDPQRHHPRDDGLLRADDRLLRREDPPLDLREIPRDGGFPDHLDEVGRRDDGDRPDLPGGPPEGDPLAGDQALRPDDRTARRTSAIPGSSWSQKLTDAQFAPPLLHRRGLPPRDDARGDPPPDADRSLVSPPDPGRSSRRRRSSKRLPPTTELLREAKRLGFSDRYLGGLWNLPEEEIRRRRYAAGIVPVYKLVDTCAAEFEAYTPYYYSTYETEDETRPSTKPKVVILGGGPNRIGQGIEFDYCCVHASFALREEGYESIMVNSNPETVSTDYDTSDKLFFEPVTLEDVLHILEGGKAAWASSSSSAARPR